MIYVLWEITAFLGCYVRKRKKILFWTLVIVMITLMGIRSINLGIKDTSGTYFTLYTKCAANSLRYCLENSYSFEPLFTIYAWIISNICNFRGFIIVTSIVCILPIAIYIDKNSSKPFDSLLIFFSLFYFYEAYLIKQMTAMVIILYSFKYIREKKPIKFIILIVLAGLIHKSAYVLVFLYPICKLFKFDKKSLLIIVLSVLIGLYGGKYVLDLVYKLGYSNYEYLIEIGTYKTGFGVNFSMFLYPMILLALYKMVTFRKELNGRQNEYKLDDYFVIVLVGCVFNIWALIVGEFFRLAMYCLIVLIVLIPNAMHISNYKNKKIIFLLCRLFFILYSFKIALNTNCLPYQFMWFD